MNTDVGECWLSRHDRPEYGDFVINVDRADPNVLITEAFLQDAYFGVSAPWMTIDKRDHTAADQTDPRHSPDASRQGRHRRVGD